MAEKTFTKIYNVTKEAKGRDSEVVSKLFSEEPGDEEVKPWLTPPARG